MPIPACKISQQYVENKKKNGELAKMAVQKETLHIFLCTNRILHCSAKTWQREHKDFLWRLRRPTESPSWQSWPADTWGRVTKQHLQSFQGVMHPALRARLDSLADVDQRKKAARQGSSPRLK